MADAENTAADVPIEAPARPTKKRSLSSAQWADLKTPQLEVISYQTSIILGFKLDVSCKNVALCSGKATDKPHVASKLIADESTGTL